MRSGAGRLACGVVGITLAGWLAGVDAVSAAAIRGVVLNAGPAPERKQIPINIDQYVCGKSRESEELIVAFQTAAPLIGLDRLSLTDLVQR